MIFIAIPDTYDYDWDLCKSSDNTFEATTASDVLTAMFPECKIDFLWHKNNKDIFSVYADNEKDRLAFLLKCKFRRVSEQEIRTCL